MGRMLKSTADAIAPSITKLFNHSIACCRPPSSWKVSSVVPIPKTAKANTTADYGPISLLSIVSKVLEWHFCFLISEHLSATSPLPNCQWGFQRGKSTISALLHTTHDWLEHLEKGAEIGAGCFDYKKAFDSVPHFPLLSKLEAIGLDQCIITWIHNYLAEGQRVVVNGVSSEPCNVASGVPQGSILGPLLFLIYIDDITKVSLSAGSRLVLYLYADDILLYRPISSLEDYRILQSDVGALANWTTMHRVFKVSKCKSMIISRKKNHGSLFPPLLLNGSVLEVVYSLLNTLVFQLVMVRSHPRCCSKHRKIWVCFTDSWECSKP